MSWISNSIARSRGRSAKPVAAFTPRVVGAEAPLSVEAQELRKQTRMMADERASPAYYAGFFLSLIVVGVLAGVAPWIPWPIFIAIIIAGTWLSGRAAKKRLLR